METMKKINLINGSFTSLEASELLMDMCNKNINFNKIQNFSSQIRFDKNDTAALQRIEMLRESVKEINETLAEARVRGKKLIIKTYLDIEFEE